MASGQKRAASPAAAPAAAAVASVKSLPTAESVVPAASPRFAPTVSPVRSVLPVLTALLSRVATPAAVPTGPVTLPSVTATTVASPVVIVTPAAMSPLAAASAGSLTAVAGPAAAATGTSAAAALLGLSGGSLGDVLQAAAAQVLGERQSRRAAAAGMTAGPIAAAGTTAGPVAAAVAPPAAAAVPITVSANNSFTTLYGTTAAGSVTVNGHVWVADSNTHLYTTSTNLAQEWQTYYSQMKAGQGSSLNNIQRLEGNAEAVFENTGLKSKSAEQLSIDRQDVQRQFDAMYAAMVGAGVNLNAPITQTQYLAVETVLQGDPTLLELGIQGHGLNNSSIARYAGYTTDFQNNTDGQTLYVGGGLNNGNRAIANFFDDNIFSHMPFPTVARKGVLWQLNQNGNPEDPVADSVAALNAGMSKTYLSSDFLQPPQLVTRTPRQVFTNGQAFTFTLPANTFVDLQGQIMTYSATLANGAALPSWVTFDTRTGTFAGTPPSGSTSTRVYVTATNTSGLHTTEAFDVQLKQPAPVIANQTATKRVTAGSPFAFALSPNTFVDPLGETMTYQATLRGGAALPAWLTFNAQNGQFAGTSPAGTKSVTVVVTATNSSGVKTSEYFAIQFSA